MNKNKTRSDVAGHRNTEILTCEKCRDHQFQDMVYGLKRRVHNMTKAGNYRCTVCNNVRSVQ